MSLSSDHHFSKDPAQSITLLQGLGVRGDCHAGETVQHCSRLKLRPVPPNLRQVLLIQLETLQSLDERQFGRVEPGQLGENVTTEGIELFKLSTGATLTFVATERGRDGVAFEDDDLAAVVRITGVRNPCPQIDNFAQGLKEKFLVRDEEGKIVGRTAGVMAVVERGGDVKPGMQIVVRHPEQWQELKCV